MENIVIILVLALLLLAGVLYTVKHFQGKGGCCGGGGAYISKKKLTHVIAQKTVIVEGMTCENCVARVTRVINDVDGLAAKVNLRKKEVCVSMEREADEAEIRGLIEKAGYTVVEFR